MAIQAQCPSTVLLPNRGEETTGGIGVPQDQHGFLDPSTVLFLEGGGGSLNPWDRGGEEASAAAAAAVLPMAIGPTSTPAQSFYNASGTFLAQPLHPLRHVALAQLQSKYNAPFVSTGLHLAFCCDGGGGGGGHQQQQQQFQTTIPGHSALYDELTPHLKQYDDDIDGFIRAQEQILRKSLAVKCQSHHRNLLNVGMAAARQRIMAKDEEVKQAIMQCAELEKRLAQLRAESLAWQAKAVTAQNQVAALQAELQQAEETAAVAREREGDSGDPTVIESSTAGRGSCYWCHRRYGATAVVVLPCRHLCLCVDCAAAGATASCPVCGGVSTGSVHVAFG